MINLTGMRGAVARTMSGFLSWFGIGLLGIAIVFASRRPTVAHLETLDPAFMEGVKAAISQRDVQAVLAHQRSSAAVHLQLFTACAEDRRCTVFTSMDFPGSEVHTPGISLQVAIQVTPGAGNAHPTIMSSWEVRTFDPLRNLRMSYAGNFNDLNKVPSIGECYAIASMLTSIRSAIVKILVADGVIASPIHTHATGFHERLGNPVTKTFSHHHRRALEVKRIGQAHTLLASAACKNLLCASRNTPLLIRL